ncbi:MAG: hypothetical protein GY716_02915 [bacterium]|nr:hypothetical protein [bacterium]
MRRSILASCCLALTLLTSAAHGQQTVGLFVNEPSASEGYTFWSTLTIGAMQLIDNEGKVVNQWLSPYPTGNTNYLLPDGTLLRASRFEPTPQPRFNQGGTGGKIERYDWDNQLLWDFTYATAIQRQHHDIVPMPNGNVLMIAWELKTQAEAIQAGRDAGLLPSGELWPETIVEIEPDGATGGNVVWEWHVWDHLIQDHDPTKDNFGVVADHPELIDVNFVNGRDGSGDWMHANAIDYDPDRDQIVIGIPFLDEIWVIDHSTTTVEAAGHIGGDAGKGGDLLYRWGNPQAYGRGVDADRTLFNQHDTEWIDAGLPGAGNILVFNNGLNRPGGNATSIDEIVPPEDEDGDYVLGPGAAYGPAAPVWTYSADPPTSFYAGFLSSAQRLPNGNTLICVGPGGVFFEITPTGDTVWRYVNPVAISGIIAQGDPAQGNRAFRAERYAPDFPGFVGQDLTPGDPLETFDAPVPAPDGAPGTTALTAERLDLGGTQLRVQWDASSCPADDYNLLYGDLSQVASYAIDGSECGLGIGGSHDWLFAPLTDLYFVVVGVDSTGVYESSWGNDGSGIERNATSPSAQCNATNKIVSESCP